MITVDTYREAEGVLRLTDLRQGLYDEGAVLMRDVLVNLHGSEHRRRRTLETRVFRRDFFRYYERESFPPTCAGRSRRSWRAAPPTWSISATASR